MNSRIQVTANSDILKGADELFSCLDAGTLKTAIQGAARASGVHPDMLVLPVLTTVAGLMGVSVVRPTINSCFSAPNVLFTAVAAPPGSRKSAALHTLIKCLEGVRPTTEEGLSQSKEYPVFTANGSITMAKLHEHLSAQKHLVMLQDELESMYEAMDTKYSGKDSLDRKVFLTLNDGSPWCRSVKSNTRQDIEATRLSYTGFFQPKVLESRCLRREEYDGFMQRNLYCYVNRKRVFYEDIGQTPDRDDLTHLFKTVYELHESEITHIYVLSEAGGPLYKQFYNSVEEQLQESPDGFLSKCTGYALRIAMIVEGTIKDKLDCSAQQICEQSMKQAIKIIKVLKSQRINVEGNNKPSSLCMNNEEYYENRTLSLTAPIDVRRMIQNKTFKPDENKKYSAATGKEFLRKLEVAGRGRFDGKLFWPTVPAPTAAPAEPDS